MGITPANIIYRQEPRNRRIAEAVARCGLVERAGQGLDLMYRECIREGKPKPDLAGTDDFQVSVTLRGDVQDPRFLRFIEKMGRERLDTFTVQDFLVLDHARAVARIPGDLRERIPRLVEYGAIERAGGGRFMLSRRFYEFLGERGAYTRERGLDHETNKALLHKHIQDSDEQGCRLGELLQVLPSLSRRQVQKLLGQLRDEGKVRLVGTTSSARWQVLR